MSARSRRPANDPLASAIPPDEDADSRSDLLGGIASDRDVAGVPIHRGWAPIGAHHRWMEPFVMVLLAGGPAHGYAIVGELSGLGITNGTVDIGQVYRTLRDLEAAEQVRSTWSTGGSPSTARPGSSTSARAASRTRISTACSARRMSDRRSSVGA